MQDKAMPLLRVKTVVIKDNVVKLYSRDGGKIWFTRAEDFRLFKERRRQNERAAKIMVLAHEAPN